MKNKNKTIPDLFRIFFSGRFLVPIDKFLHVIQHRKRLQTLFEMKISCYNIAHEYNFYKPNLRQFLPLLFSSCGVGSLTFSSLKTSSSKSLSLFSPFCFPSPASLSSLFGSPSALSLRDLSSPVSPLNSIWKRDQSSIVP